MRTYRTFDRDSCSIPWGLATYCSELRHYIVDNGKGGKLIDSLLADYDRWEGYSKKNSQTITQVADAIR